MKNSTSMYVQFFNENILNFVALLAFKNFIQFVYIQCININVKFCYLGPKGEMLSPPIGYFFMDDLEGVVEAQVELRRMVEEMKLNMEDMVSVFQCESGSFGDQILSLFLADSAAPSVVPFDEMLNKFSSVLLSHVSVQGVLETVSDVREYMFNSQHLHEELKKWGEKLRPPVQVDAWFGGFDSKLDLLPYFIKFRQPIEKILSRPEHLAGPVVASSDYGTAEEVLKLYEILQKRIDACRKSKYFLTSQALPYLKMIIDENEKLKIYSPLVCEVKHEIISLIKSEMSMLKTHSIYCKASAMDPRYKTHVFRNREDILIHSQCKNDLMKDLEKICRQPSAMEEKGDIEEAPKTKMLGNDFRDFVNLETQKNSETTYEEAEKQLKLFLSASDLQGESCDVFKFWKDRACVNGHVTKLAIKCLSVPAKRLVSLAQLTHSKHLLDKEGIQEFLLLSSLSKFDWEI